MCLQDLAISRSAEVRSGSKACTGVTRILGANPDRIALFVNCINATDLRILVQCVASARYVAVSWSNPGGTQYVRIDVHNHPGVITGELYVQNDLDDAIDWIEVVLSHELSPHVAELMK